MKAHQNLAAVRALAKLEYALAVERAERAHRTRVEAEETLDALNEDLERKIDFARRYLRMANPDPELSYQTATSQGLGYLAATLAEMHEAAPELCTEIPDVQAVLQHPEKYLEAWALYRVHLAQRRFESALEVLDDSQDAEQIIFGQFVIARRAFEAAVLAVKTADAELDIAVRRLETTVEPEPACEESPPEDRPPIRLRHISTRSVLTAAPPARVFALAA